MQHAGLDREIVATHGTGRDAAFQLHHEAAGACPGGGADPEGNFPETVDRKLRYRRCRGL